MYTGAIETLLEDFMTISDEIEGVVMVSNQGQPLTHSLGISEESIRLLAGKMLYLAGCVSEECDWHCVDMVTIQAQEGYLILVECGLDAFLLIRAAVVPTGYVQRHIQQYLAKFEAALQSRFLETTAVQQSSSPIEHRRGAVPCSDSPAENLQERHPPLQRVSSSTPLHLNENEIAYCQQELTEVIGPIASLICERILLQHPDLRLTEFIQALSDQIPNPEAAYKFRKRLMPDIP